MEHIWKYLSEKSTKYTTSLKEYLGVIFPTFEFVYDEVFPQTVFATRASTQIRPMEYHRYRPDARCEDLSLIIEFDGIDHYSRFDAIVNDNARDIWFQCLGYHVVRLPYWLALSSEAVKHKFGILLDIELCQLKYSFFDSKYHGLLSGPSAMCEAGRQRFVHEFNRLPLVLREHIGVDLLVCRNFTVDSDMFMPRYIEKLLDIPKTAYDIVADSKSAFPDPSELLHL